MSEPAGSLTLYAIVPSGGGQCKELELTADFHDNGMDIKKKIEKACNIPVEDMELFIKNPSEGSTNKWLRDDATLEAEKIEDLAVLTVGVHGTTGGGNGYLDDEDLPQTAVENSLAAKGETSYYFAHSRKMEVPEEHRIVSGGSPQKLGETQLPLSEPVPAKKQLSSELVRPERAILNYAWGDEQAAVKIYVSADAEQEALAAAGDGNAGQVEVSFLPKSVSLRIHAEKVDWVLELDPLYYEILPDECKFRTSAAKRITLTLKKKEAYTWLKLLKPDAWGFWQVLRKKLGSPNSSTSILAWACGQTISLREYQKYVLLHVCAFSLLWGLLPSHQVPTSLLEPRVAGPASLRRFWCCRCLGIERPSESRCLEREKAVPSSEVVWVWIACFVQTQKAILYLNGRNFPKKRPCTCSRIKHTFLDLIIICIARSNMLKPKTLHKPCINQPPSIPQTSRKSLQTSAKPLHISPPKNQKHPKRPPKKPPKTCKKRLPPPGSRGCSASLGVRPGRRGWTASDASRGSRCLGGWADDTGGISSGFGWKK